MVPMHDHPKAEHYFSPVCYMADWSDVNDFNASEQLFVKFMTSMTFMSHCL